jgi:G3E family GTPase
MFESGRRWLDAAATLDPAQVRHERRARVNIVRRVLAPARIAVDDWENASFVLRSPTGRTEIVDNLFDLWRAAEKLGRSPLDLLANAVPTERSRPYNRSPNASSSRAGLSPSDTPARAPQADTNWREPPASNAPSPPGTAIPLHILTGFLGSGKTTLLNRMLRDPALQDTAVLINEIGAIAIDHHLVDRMAHGDAVDIVVLKGGCACCALRGDLVAALRELYARRVEGSIPAFRRVVLETTGLADPAPLLFTLTADPALRHKFTIGGTIATIDAVHGLDQLARHPESRKQVAVADRVVLTKTDLVSEGSSLAVTAALRRINPAAVIHAAGSLEGSGDLLQPAPAVSVAAYRVGMQVPDPARDHSSHAEHTADVQSVAFVLEELLDWSAWAVWLTLLLHAHGASMLRFKALLNLAGAAAPVALDGVHHLIHPPRHLNAWPQGPRESRLVFIGQRLPVDRIEPSLRAFMADVGARDLPAQGNVRTALSGTRVP